MWIEERRRARGWSRTELARRARCSPELVALLEEQGGAVTHPMIAARIAAALGASRAQMESIVPKRRDEDGRAYDGTA